MSNASKTVDNGVWVVEQDVQFNSLTIANGSSISAPEGKFVTLTVDGVGFTPEPGTYRGDVRLSVRDLFVRTSMRFGQESIDSFRSGVCICDGEIVGGSSALDIVREGTVTNTEANNVRIDSNEWDFNGFYITGDSTYTINDAKINLTGDGTDDFVGLGAGIGVAGTSKVTVNNSEIHTRGITRGTVFVGGNAEVTLNDCDMSIESYVPTAAQMEEGGKLHRMMQPPWAMSIRGHGRATNLAGWGIFNLNRCHVTSNSWGVLSVDGATVNRMYVKDSLVELIGDSGYGTFSICDDVVFDYKAFGDYGCVDVIDNSTVNVPSHGIIMSLGNSSGEYKNGSIVNSKRFGAFIFRNSGGLLKVNSKSVFNTGISCVSVKGSNSYIELDDAIMNPANGTILQLQDDDDTGMGDIPFLVPIGETDVRDERDLTVAIPDEDVFVTVSNMEANGSFFNSTTNLMACCRKEPGTVDDGPHMDFGQVRGMGEDLQGAKNLDMKVVNATVRGYISSATQAYGDGITRITRENCEELGEITQTSAKPVNNGVILSLDKTSSWIIPGDCYLTKLTIENGARLAGADGRALRMIVDGVEREIAPGMYTGLIEVKLV